MTQEQERLEERTTPTGRVVETDRSSSPTGIGTAAVIGSLTWFIVAIVILAIIIVLLHQYAHVF